MTVFRWLLAVVCLTASFAANAALRYDQVPLQQKAMIQYAALQPDAIAAAHNLVAQAFPEGKQAHGDAALLATLANDQAVWSLFQNTSYANDESCEINLGTLTLHLKWGFAGSGDSLSVLPGMDLQVKTNAPTGHATAEGFALLLAQKGLIAHGKQQLPVIKKLVTLLSENPLYLVALKLALLFKDHSHERAFVQAEIACLLSRLMLTKLPDAVSKIDKISAVIPDWLHVQIKTFAPDLLDFMDISWSAMTHNSNDPLAELYTVEVLMTKSASAVPVINTVIGTCPGRSLMTDVKEACLAKGLKCFEQERFDALKPTDLYFVAGFTVNSCLSTVLDRLPAEVREVLQSASMHTVVSVEAAGIHYFAYKTPNLSATDTAQAFAITLMNGARRMVQARQVYFASHPLAVAEHKKAEKDARIQRVQVARFLATEEGKSFTRNFEAKIELLKQGVATNAQQAVAAQPAENPATLLAAFRQQAEAFRAAGQEVPAEITAAINDLAAKVVVTVDTPALIDAAEITKNLAKIHSVASEILATSLRKARDNHAKACAKVTDKYQKLMLTTQFELDQAPAKAYQSSLEQEMVRLCGVADQIEKLVNYRLLHKCGVLNSTQEDKLAEMAQLEMQIGYLLDCQTPVILINALRRAPTTVDFIKHELCSNHVAYKALQDDMLNQLMLIIRRSPHLQENLDVYRYSIELFMPNLLPMFDRLVAAQQAVL